MAEETTKNMAIFTDPQEMVKEIAAINAEVKKYPRPGELKQRLTERERLEKDGLDSNNTVPIVWNLIMVLSAIGGFITFSMGGGEVAYTIMVMCVFGSVLPAIPVGRALSTTKGTRLWTRILRKKHYLKLHEKQKTEIEIERKAYEMTLAKHEKTVKRMRKRAKPVIDAYNAKEPMKELVLTQGGLISTDRYTPEQRRTLEIADTLVPGAIPKPRSIAA